MFYDNIFINLIKKKIILVSLFSFLPGVFVLYVIQFEQFLENKSIYNFNLKINMKNII